MVLIGIVIAVNCFYNLWGRDNYIIIAKVMLTAPGHASIIILIFSQNLNLMSGVRVASVCFSGSFWFLTSFGPGFNDFYQFIDLGRAYLWNAWLND